jgi:hypothetical protein
MSRLVFLHVGTSVQLLGWFGGPLCPVGRVESGGLGTRRGG